MSDPSILINRLLSSTTTENPLEVIKRQQEQIQRQLLQQELLNTNLYQSLLISGLLQNNNLRAPLPVTPPTTTASNILNLLQNRNLLNSNLLGNLGSNNGETTSATSIGNSLNNLASILPLGDAFSSLGTVFEKLFGTKFWIYAVLALVIGILFTIVSCFCMYCCCCSKLGRNLLCCCKWSKMSKSSKSSSKKKTLTTRNDSRLVFKS